MRCLWARLPYQLRTLAHCFPGPPDRFPGPAGPVLIGTVPADGLGDTILPCGGTAVPDGIGAWTLKVGNMLFPSPPPSWTLWSGRCCSVMVLALAIRHGKLGIRFRSC